MQLFARSCGEAILSAGLVYQYFQIVLRNIAVSCFSCCFLKGHIFVSMQMVHNLHRRVDPFQNPYRAFRMLLVFPLRGDIHWGCIFTGVCSQYF